MKELIGKKIIGLRISDDQGVLAFDTDQGVIAYITYGDCCSETWFADITGVNALLGGIVQTADTVSMDGYNVEDGRARQEYDQAYGVKLVTDKGYADIVFRNSSNGYYGGWIELLGRKLLLERDWPESRMDLPENMTAITDDWRA